MSDANRSLANDLPPRTWRSWWLAWPKWFRIGCWAALGMVLLHVALAGRIYVGLMEPPEIQALRRPGVHVIFASGRRGEPFPGFHRLMDGIKGISCEDVVAIRLDEHGTDADLELIGRSFPQLQSLYLARAEVTSAGLEKLRPCQKLYEIDLRETDLDDSAAQQLAELPRLSSLDLTGTLVGDATLTELQNRLKLNWFNLSYTDVSFAAIQAARSQRPGVPFVIGTEKDQISSGFLGSIHWSDGRRTGRFAGKYELRVSGPIVNGRSTRGFTLTSSGLTRQSMWWDAKQFQQPADGEYQFTVKLEGIESAPASVTIKQGLPSASLIEFQMPCTKAEALQSARSNKPE